jgi:hypothetical protein
MIPRTHTIAITALALTASLPASAGAAAATHVCKSSDLRYSFSQGGPKAFGVFDLRISGGTCATAHRVAKTWMRKFERNVHNGSEKRPHTARGFTFTSHAANEAQAFRVKGTHDLTTIRFKYRVPNG